MQGVDVSVIVITYNQEKYIREALNSIVMQKTDYSYEILIGDDASTDGTPNIIKEYHEMYPEIIKPIIRTDNVGGTRNSYDLYKNASGRYIMHLEGDDCWKTDNIVQNYISFLESNPKYMAICGRCEIINSAGEPVGVESINESTRFWEYDRDVFSLSDFTEWKMPGHISAMAYRNIYKLNRYDTSILVTADSMIGDRTIIMIICLYGDIFCDDSKVLKYRFVETSDAGNWMSLYKKENKRPREYRYICVLDNYLKDNKVINHGLNDLKRSKVAAVTLSYMLNKTEQNKIAVKEIWKQGNPVLMRLISLNSIIQKKFWILMGKPNHRVKV